MRQHILAKTLVFKFIYMQKAINFRNKPERANQSLYMQHHDTFRFFREQITVDGNILNCQTLNRLLSLLFEFRS